jgi:hypothetical protein
MPPVAPQSPSSIIGSWYNRPAVAAVPSGLSLIPIVVVVITTTIFYNNNNNNNNNNNKITVRIVIVIIRICKNFTNIYRVTSLYSHCSAMTTANVDHEASFYLFNDGKFKEYLVLN